MMTDVYGDIICQVPVTRMIEDNYIVPPNLITVQV